MYTSRKKIQKDKDVEPSEFEESVAQALFDLENANQDLKSDLKDLYINGAIQIDVAGNRKAVVINEEGFPKNSSQACERDREEVQWKGCCSLLNTNINTVNGGFYSSSVCFNFTSFTLSTS